MSFTLTKALEWWWRECPNEVALHIDDEPLTWKGLWMWAGRIGQDLTGRGIKAGDRIAVVAANSMDYVALTWGCLRIGAIPAPMSLRATARELREEMETFTPSLVFVDEARRAVVAEALGEASAKGLLGLPSVRAQQHGEPAVITHEAKPDDVAFIVGTSGSTAKPKRVIYTHRTVVSYGCEFVVMQPRCGHGAKVLSMGPFSSTSGFLLMLEFLSMGLEMFIESQFIPERALKILVEEKITVMQHPPIFFERISALPEFADADLSNLYFAQTAGARIPMSLLAAWRAKGVILRHAYGSSEAGGGWAARDDTALDQPQKCGRGGMFTEFAIMGEDGKLAPPGTPGQIVSRGACLTPGYWNNPAATAEAIPDGWLRTGDLGVQDELGALTFIDRIKDIVISGGLNISAIEVENVISDVPGVEEVAVISAPDPKFGETPMAIVYGDQTKFTVADIIAHCDKNLSNYKVPRYVAVEDAPLPRVPAGKISKVELRAKYKDATSYLPKVR